MAYYSREEIKKFIDENNETLKEKNMKPFTDYEEATKKVQDKEPLIAFMWANIIEELDKETNLPTVKMKMDGKVFVRLDDDLYTDDRFAIDSYQAQLENISVLEVIRRRQKETEEARKKVDPEFLKKFESYLKQK
jgi:phage terminase small subunit